MSSEIDMKQALVLSGGGAAGAYEAGVAHALLAGASPATGFVPLDPAVISGTSIGSYNGAVLTSMLDASGSTATGTQLVSIWVNSIPFDSKTGSNHFYRVRGDPPNLAHPLWPLMNPVAASANLVKDGIFFAGEGLRVPAEVLQSQGSPLKRAIQTIDLSAVISREPYERLIDETVDFTAIARTERRLIIAASNWGNGKVRLFANRDLTDRPLDTIDRSAILASSALPGFFEPVVIGDETFVDGGLLMNTPLKPAAHDLQIDDVHVVYVDPYLVDIPLPTEPNTLDTINRLLAITLSRNFDTDIETARRVNEGIKIVDRAARGEPVTQEDALPFIRVASRIAASVEGRDLPVSLKTIHRYRPRSQLTGAFDLLDFSADRVRELIELGYRDAVEHDCDENNCVIP